MDIRRGIAVLGATGSIGTQTLDVVRSCLPGVRVRVLTGYGNSEMGKLTALVREFKPDMVWVPEGNVTELRERLKTDLGGSTPKPPQEAQPLDPIILTGEEGLLAAASQSDADVVVNALAGRAGLGPTLAAIGAGKHVALANKESLVSAGSLVMAAARARGVRVTPIDSEHSAIWQCLQGNDGGNGAPLNPFEKIILTASGGPFRTWARADIAAATAADALRHPNWRMGPKITIDSATMMNKGLEYIEALHLFDAAPAQVEIVVHPQSIVHSAVQFADGAVVAQMGLPDMRLPILYALAGPARVANDFPRMDFFAHSLTFEPPDEARFPCLTLAKQAAATGGTAPAVLNAVNEWAVHEFLRGAIRFYDISAIISRALHEYTVQPLRALDDVREAERFADTFVTHYRT